MKKNKIVFLILFFVVFFTLITILLSYSGKIAKNPEGTIGNTTGNLNNNGYFCQNKDVVYFANAYDNYCLYKMNVDETEVEKISNAKVKYINSAGKYLYYYQEDSSVKKALGFITNVIGVYRSDLNGKNVFCLKKEPSGIILLVDNSLFFQNYNNSDGMTLYKTSLDKSEEIKVADMIINPAGYANGKIYFNGMENDHYLYTLDTTNNSIDLAWQGNVWNPTVVGDYVYYMDISNNYCLSRYSIYENTVEILTSDRIDLYNIYGNYIYYQKNSTTSPALKRMQLDGTNEEIIMEGNFQNINITSSYVYFNSFGSQIPIYKTPTEGSVSVTEFSAAFDGVDTTGN